MGGTSGRYRRLSYTWGDGVVTLIAVAGIVYAAVLAGELAPAAERKAERAFWAAWLVGGLIASGAWVWYARHPERLREDREKRDRNRASIVTLAPTLGIAGLILAKFALYAVLFGFLGAGSGFKLVVMVGYAVVVRRQRRRVRKDRSAEGGGAPARR